MSLMFSVRLANDYLFGKKLFIRFVVRVFRECLPICVCTSFLFGFEGGILDLIVLIIDHCLSFKFGRYLKGAV